MDQDADILIFDPDHLQAMTDGDNDLAVEIIDIFRQQVESWGRLLDPDLPPENWVDAVHTLKGAALGVGALRLAQKCGEAERAGRAGQISKVEAALLLAQVKDAMAMALEAIAIKAHEFALKGH